MCVPGFRNDERLQVSRGVGLSLEAGEPFDQSRTHGGEDVRFAKHSRPESDCDDKNAGCAYRSSVSAVSLFDIVLQAPHVGTVCRHRI